MVALINLQVLLEDLAPVLAKYYGALIGEGFPDEYAIALVRDAQAATLGPRSWDQPETQPEQETTETGSRTLSDPPE